jgi:hypothetical protein
MELHLKYSTLFKGKDFTNDPITSIPPEDTPAQTRISESEQWQQLLIQTRDVYKLEGGKIVKSYSYFDFYGLLAQLAPGKLINSKM